MLFTLEISNPMFIKPWHFRADCVPVGGWLWFAIAIYAIPPGVTSFVAQQKQPNGNADA